jgi:prephenate dehydratase
VSTPTRSGPRAPTTSASGVQTNSVSHSPTASVSRVAFQGERGAFSEEAALRLLGESVALVPRKTFESLFAAVGEGAADYALAPFENTLAGSVQKCYDLLLESTLRIVAEVIIPVHHCLVGCPGSSLDAIRAVESHPVALAQCERFFAAHASLRRVVAEDTAGSAARVVRRGDPTRAAIAGRRAAEIYGGQILLEGVEDDRENYTRFLLLAPAANEGEGKLSDGLPELSDGTNNLRNDADKRSNGADKLSLVLKLPHRPGALHHALEPFARRRIDLLKIESRPVRGEPWQYHIFLDLSASLDDADAAEALAELRARTASVRLLGCYPSARAATLNDSVTTDTD